MKILLVGEYSSLHKNLKEGLKELGYNAVLAAGGDSWKKIGGIDLPLGCVKYHGLNLKTINQYFVQPFIDIQPLRGYDIVQFVSPRLFHPLINQLVMEKIIKNNRMISLCAAGGDLAIVEAYKTGKFEYYVFDYDKTTLNQYNTRRLYGLMNTYFNKKLEKIASVIIPSLYEYSLNHIQKKTVKPIPFPINVDSIRYKDNIVKQRIVFFHGLNREFEKGTPFIREALLKLKKNYPNDVDVIIDGHMPFDKYLRVINNANVIIDQCCGYGYGMNACISMAQGKVVMSSCRSDTLKAYGVKSSPIIHAKPDVDYLYNQLIMLLENRNSLTEWGYKSRVYVEHIHDYRKVAKEYMDVWKSKM